MSKIVYRGKKAPNPTDNEEKPEQSIEQQPTADPPATEAVAPKEPEKPTRKSSSTRRSSTPTEKSVTEEPSKDDISSSAKATNSTQSKRNTNAENNDGTVAVKKSRSAKKANIEEKQESAETATPTQQVSEETAVAAAVADSTEKPTKTEVTGAYQAEFDKEGIIKYFKRHPKMQINTKVDRFTPETNKGLTSSQVETRFSQYLFNDTNKKYSKSYASIFIGNICTFFNLLCLLAFIALLISGIKGITNYLVIVITAANIGIGVIQEIRSKLAVDKLSIMAKSNTKVIRDGEVVEVPTTEIVLDDVIILELGNQVPADCILAEGSVEVNESLLTGESVAIKKNVGDVLYAGSFIASGNGKCRVDKVGKETFLEKLTAKAKKYQRPKSELMNSITGIIRTVSIVIFPIAIGVFFVTRSNGAFDGVEINNWLLPEIESKALAKTCSVVIGMIPSGMLLLTSVALAVGVVRLSKNNTLVRDLYSLEMLARVNVLCLDKTGTITDGRMTVSDAVILNTVGELSLNEIMGNMISALDDNNQTSIALANHFGHSETLTPSAKMPFSSKRKLSAVTFDGVGTFVMGAPEFVLKPLPPKVERIVKQYAQMGLRVIVLAHSSSSISGDKLPAVLKPIAIISIADNIREDAIDTIKWFKENDVHVKVISGDNPITVSEVAKRAGIENADKYISLEGLNDNEVENVANKYTVFGRVTPEQKALLIRSIKSEGNTVAMTGDGVNDILALKEADCAISVASGSEAARNVSHLVLMDNNFANMPKIVSEGRRVINNIKNSASLYLMKTLFTAILAILTILFRTEIEGYPFLPSNMLLLEIFIIGIPSFFLSLQPNNERVQGKFITHVMSRSIPGALVMVLCVMAMYITCTYVPGFREYRTAMCMMALTFSGLVMLFRVCQPLNAYRLILFALMFGLCLTAFIMPPIFKFDVPESLCAGWRTLNWSTNGNYAKILIVVVAIEAAFPISQWLINIMQIILPSSTENKVKSSGNKDNGAQVNKKRH